MTHASAEMQTYYAIRAPVYDAVYLKPERREDISFLEKYLPTYLQGRHVLEIACGTGYWTQHLAPAVSSMVATDGTADPLSFARLRPRTENVTFRQADAYALPDDLGVFNGAFAGLWFSHVPINAREVFLSGLHAHLTVGSRVILIDNTKAQLLDFPIAETDSDGNTYQYRTLPDKSTHKVLKNFPSEEELRVLLSPYAGNFHFRELENFWLCEYDLR